jgi:hypothetical protein
MYSGKNGGMDNFCLKKNYLYEILATTFFWDDFSKKNVYNTSCMGIQVLSNDSITIKPYPTTQTYKNLEKNGFIILNFVDNIYYYALAALKSPQSNRNIKKFPKRYYSFKKDQTLHSILQFYSDKLKGGINQIPYIKNAWGIIIGFVVDSELIAKKSDLGTTQLTQFIIKPILSELLRKSYHLYNRAENLALEMIILATRLKVAFERGDKKVIHSIKKKIANYESDINRFSQNKQVFKTIEVIKDYCSQFIQIF